MKIRDSVELKDFKLFLDDSSPCFRPAACDEITSRLSQLGSEKLSKEFKDTLVKLLGDWDSVEQLGVSGVFDFAGRLVLWRQETYLPCASAATALIASQTYPPNLLDAMLDATNSKKMEAFLGADLFVFPADASTHTVKAAGGFRETAPKIAQAHADAKYEVAKRNLYVVLNRLSGRLLN